MRALVTEHDERFRALIEGNDGYVVKATGDGFHAAFGRAADAVAAAEQLQAAIADLADIKVRMGINTGEIELRPSDLAGIAVHIANRITTLADSNEILVSRTVVDLTAGSGLQFEPRGDRELKGVPGTWPIFAVQPTA